MQTEYFVEKNIFGFYELTRDGTVLYSRPCREDSSLDRSDSELVGQDLFRDVMPFRNTNDLRRQFRNFISGRRPVGNLVFDGFLESEVVRAKVFLARANETNGELEDDIIIMDIKRIYQ